MTRIYLVRHAQTDGNLQQHVHGSADLPINQAGKEQAKMLREHLRVAPVDICAPSFDICISSPMRRCIETVEILAPENCRIEVDDRLTERGYGVMEGVHFSQIDYEGFWGAGGQEIFYDGAETIAQVRARVEDFLRYVKQTYTGKTVLVVSHGSIARVMRGILAGQGFCGDYSVLPRTGNCEYLRFEI